MITVPPCIFLNYDPVRACGYRGAGKYSYGLAGLHGAREATSGGAFAYDLQTARRVRRADGPPVHG